MKSKLIKGIIACVVVAGIGFGGYFGYTKFFASSKTVTTSSQYYTTSVVKKNLSVTVQGTGSALSGSTKDVTVNNEGVLKNLSVGVGSTIKAGQALFTSYSSSVEKAVTTAKNNLTKANLTYSTDASATVVDSNKLASDSIAVSEAKTALSEAKASVNNMTVYAPISGTVTAVNSSNGDSVSSAKSVLTIADLSNIKVTVAVDELDINKVAVGQTASVLFDAIDGQTFEGTVESISQTGTTSNNVTTYSVVVGVKNPSGIKLGMNATVTINIQNKDDVLAIPVEALVEQNGKKYVRVESTGTTSSSSSANSTGSSTSTSSSSQSSTAKSSGSKSSATTGTTSGNYTLVEVKTGIETSDYIEITSGITEGQKIVVKLPSTSSSTSTKGSSAMGGMNMGGALSGGGTPPSGAAR